MASCKRLPAGRPRRRAAAPTAARCAAAVALAALTAGGLRACEALGSDHTCAVTDAAAATCWGGNDAGQCGVAPPSDRERSFTALSQDDGFELLQLSTGPQSTCGVFFNAAADDYSDTHIKCWGQNFGGSGYPSADLQPWAADLAAVDVETCDGIGCSPPSIAQVAVGGNHVCALNDQHEVKCWGQNAFGQLGYGDRLSRGGTQYLQYNVADIGELPAVDLGTYRELTTAGAQGDPPVTVGAVQISAGYDHTCAVVVNLESSIAAPAATHRYVKCWGRNQYGQLGLGDVASRGDEPFEMGNNLTSVDLDATGRGWTPKSVACGRDHTCVLFNNGRVSCWGSNELGAVGNAAGGPVFTASLVRVGDQPMEMGAYLGYVDLGTDPQGNEMFATSVVADYGRSCATLLNGTAKCWGANELHCGNAVTRGLLGAAYGRGGTQSSSNRYLGDGLDEMGDDLMTLFFENPDAVTSNESTVTVADLTLGRCHACALLLPATCSDGIQNQDEERVDCGGPQCAACPGNSTAEAEASCDVTCFDRPPRTNLDFCQFSGYASVELGCAASPVGYCDATCGVCTACPRARRPATGQVECFGNNYVAQLGLTASNTGDNAAYADDYNEKLYSGDRGLLKGTAAQLSCALGVADACGCEGSFRGTGCADVVDECAEDPCLFGARCYTYYAVVNPVTGKTRERFECDCSTALVDGVGGDRCQIDEAAPTVACGSALPIEISDTYIANYTFLLDFLHYGAYCTRGAGDYFPTTFTGDDGLTPDCTGATTTHWAADNIALQDLAIVPAAGSLVDVCDDAAFVAASAENAAFCGTGASAAGGFFWGAPDQPTYSITVTATDLGGQTTTCDVSLYSTDSVKPTVSCADLDFTDHGVVNEAGQMAWNLTLVPGGAPMVYDDPDLFGQCTATDNAANGVQTVDILASSTWAPACGSTDFAEFERVDGATGDASFDVTYQDCVHLTYHTADGSGGTAHTTGLTMFARPVDRFGNGAAGFLAFSAFFYDVVDPTVSCPAATVTVADSDALSTGSNCVFSPSLVAAADADSGVAQVVFVETGSGSAVATWTVNAAGGACAGGDVALDATFAATLAGLGVATTFNVDATVSDASVINGDARQSSPVTCSNFAVQVTV